MTPLVVHLILRQEGTHVVDECPREDPSKENCIRPQNPRWQNWPHFSDSPYVLEIRSKVLYQIRPWHLFLLQAVLA